MPRVLIAPAPLANLQARFVEVLQEAGFDLVYPQKRAQLTEDELKLALTGCQASLAGSEPYTRAVLEANPQLRAIARAGVGYDAVDLAAATDHGVAVTIAPGTNQHAVAEHTFALILALAKNVVNQHVGTVNMQWPRKANLPLRGKTLGVAGLGRIGKEVALRGKAFHMNVIAYEPYPDQAFVSEHKIPLVAWDDLLARSDYLSLHLPATEASRYLLNRTTFERMKPGAFLVNTSRGSIVNEADLIAALESKHLGGAGLDVFEQEPPAHSTLFAMENVVVTPHAAGVDLLSRDDMAQSAAEAIVSLHAGKWPTEKVVNPDVQAHYRWA